jgi:hypothetical protein
MAQFTFSVSIVGKKRVVSQSGLEFRVEQELVVHGTLVYRSWNSVHPVHAVATP